jgi:hypothetical protein
MELHGLTEFDIPARESSLAGRTCGRFLVTLGVYSSNPHDRCFGTPWHAHDICKMPYVRYVRYVE